ncbi:Alcohol dehydrogenase zinc-binding domain protein [Mesorhizobium plurifarium]|uniref:Alcohol dehydrogenase zinc-binding domain protein n=1 Tax=Mesorhizobium plurifarium TaxID=69974 RepID=A0A090DSB0_MESPL|nr:Alcohol dehydrogenase zinc-binding domain protein [Mesorhizobium plurifarium]CDX54346.1 Alcohol dehydrogenase zinc-binding domain protein [Mesorhizobium plurifarium]
MVQVRQSTIIDAPIEEVWAILRDFNGHDRWHPAIASSEIDGGEPADAVGAVRHFRLADGGELREQLLALSDKDRRLSYCLLEAPLPLMGYVASIRLKPVTDGNATFWEWRSEFHPPAHRRDELVKLVAEDIYRAGFAAIRNLLAGRDAAVPAVARPSPAIMPSRPTGVAPSSIPTPSILTPSLGAEETTRAILVERYGGPDVLQLKQIALRQPAPDEVRIRHTAIGVNFIDVYCRTGFFDLLRLPGVPGMEAAGVIEAVGPAISGLSVGDRIAYACPPVGAYAERRNMTADLLVRLSDDLSDETAAASLLKGVTASFLLHDIHAVRPGEVVLIHAGAGGIGQLLVQWARHLGATVIATVSSDDKARIVERLGAHHVIVYSREDFAEAVMRLTAGAGANVIYDAVGVDTFAGSLAALAVRGHLVSFGQASGPVGSWDIGRLASKSITVSRPNYAHYTNTPEKLAPHVDRFFTAFRQRAVRVGQPAAYGLANAEDAHRDLEARRTSGALVLMP